MRIERRAIMSIRRDWPNNRRCVLSEGWIEFTEFSVYFGIQSLKSHRLSSESWVFCRWNGFKVYFVDWVGCYLGFRDYFLVKRYESDANVCFSPTHFVWRAIFESQTVIVHNSISLSLAQIEFWIELRSHRASLQKNLALWTSCWLPTEATEARLDAEQPLDWAHHSVTLCGSAIKAANSFWILWQTELFRIFSPVCWQRVCGFAVCRSVFFFNLSSSWWHH